MLVDDATSRQLYEFDGLGCEFTGDHLMWHAFECKDPRAGGGVGQSARLASLLTVSATRAERTSTTTQKAYESKFLWP